MSEPLPASAHDQLFLEARTYRSWEDRPVEAELLQTIYDEARMGPTSSNCCPARFVFLTRPESKERLKPHLSEGNVKQTMSAPVCVIIASDMEFYELLPKLSPHNDARSWFVGKEKLIESTALRNGSLQGAYLMLAARAHGLDCGPMSGFSPKGVNEEFFPDSNWRVNFLCNLGYGEGSRLHPRQPRLGFEEACQLL